MRRKRAGSRSARLHAARSRRALRFQGQFGKPGHRRERIIQFVCDTRRHFADRCPALDRGALIDCRNTQSALSESLVNTSANEGEKANDQKSVNFFHHLTSPSNKE